MLNLGEVKFRTVTAAMTLSFRLRSLFSFPDSLSVEDRILIVNRSISFTFVRHPFVRLVSAYQVTGLGSDLKS